MIASGTWKNIEEVAKAYQIIVAIEAFIELPPVTISEHFQQELAYILRNIDVRMSEAAISEFLIAPVLREVWKEYAEYLSLWSHVALSVDSIFDGYPDYLFTKRSPLGLVRDKPYLLVIEAKKDDFEGGWGQCLAAMLAAQIVNHDTERIVQGCVSNGEVWQFGKLQESRFVRDPRPFTISALNDMFSALHDVFTRAKIQAAEFA